MIDTFETVFEEKLPDILYQKLSSIEPYFVTPPDADIDTKHLATIIAEAINSL